MDLSELAGVPQSTPKKSKDNSAEQSTSSLPSALTLSLTSPEPAVVRPRTQPTLSGRYLARPPTWKLQEVSIASQMLPLMFQAKRLDIVNCIFIYF